MESIDKRKEALVQWLSVIRPEQSISVQEILGDASFRRYFRIYTSEGSFIAMDAAPPNENCAPYVAIANALRNIGLKTPEILAADLEQGFLLLTDFGDLTFLKILNDNNADQLYTKALSALTILQSCKDVPGRIIPPFTAEFMWQEWLWHKDWFLGRLLGIDLQDVEKDLDRCMQILTTEIATQPQVFMHRDYHAANLMLLPNEEIGLLDFQDAFIGPVTYDLASLLRDCYITWPEDQVLSWARYYWQQLREKNVLSNIECHAFVRWFDWMCLQRHLKALFTFARKKIRDQNTQYLQHVPRTLQYILIISSRYKEFSALHRLYAESVKPTFEKVYTCVQ